MAEAQVIYISGNFYERKLVLEKIKNQLSSYEIFTVEGDFTTSYLEQIVKQNSVFDESRLIIVKDLPSIVSSKATMINQLKKIIDSIPNSCVVVFYGVEDKALSNHISKIGKCFEYETKVEKKDAANYLVNIFKDLGKDISTSNAQIIVDTSGYDASSGGVGVSLLRTLANKISLYIGNKKKNIEIEDINCNIFPSEEVIIWSMFDALDSRDLTKCYIAFNKLIDKEQSIVGAANLLYNISLPRYRMLFFLKEGISKGKSKQEITKEALSLKKYSQTGYGWEIKLKQDVSESSEPKMLFSEFSINSALNSFYGKKPTVDLYSRKDILRILNILESAIVELRARVSSEVAISVLVDVLFFSICTSLDDDILSNMRKPYAY